MPNLLIESKIKNTFGRYYWGVEVERDIFFIINNIIIFIFYLTEFVL